MSDELSALADVLQRRRIERGLSKNALAKAVGIDEKQIRRYEAGEAQPGLHVAKRMARVLGISLDELAGEPDGGNTSLEKPDQDS